MNTIGLSTISIASKDDTELCGGILIAELDHIYEPVANVATLGEAIELAIQDLRLRQPDVNFCPEAYVIWERGPTGGFDKTYTLIP